MILKYLFETLFFLSLCISHNLLNFVCECKQALFILTQIQWEIK